MKQFIVLLAVLPISLVFLAQFTLDLKVNAKIDSVNNIVYTAKEEAKQLGGFSDEKLSDIKTRIASVCNVPESSVVVEGSPKGSKKRMIGLSSAEEMNKDKLIRYYIKVPVEEISILGKLIKGAGKQYYYVIDSYTASELL